MFKYPLLAAFLALVACAAEKEAPTADALPKVQLALNWFPEAEHGGLYAAAVHGYYEEKRSRSRNPRRRPGRAGRPARGHRRGSLWHSQMPTTSCTRAPNKSP